MLERGARVIRVGGPVTVPSSSEKGAIQISIESPSRAENKTARSGSSQAWGASGGGLATLSSLADGTNPVSVGSAPSNGTIYQSGARVALPFESSFPSGSQTIPEPSHLMRSP